MNEKNILRVMWLILATMAGGLVVALVMAATVMSIMDSINEQLKGYPSGQLTQLEYRLNCLETRTDLLDSRILGITRWEEFLSANPSLVNPEEESDEVQMGKPQAEPPKEVHVRPLLQGEGG